jgi:hypothetical protein
VETQSKRAYTHLQNLLKIEGNCDTARSNPDVIESIQSETTYKNGSIVEVLGGTINQVNGPHPQKVGADEVELMDPVVFDESRNMSASAGDIKAQDWITSTRKRAHGLMQHLIDEIDQAIQQGFDPPYKLYTWCIFETAKNVPGCGTTCGCEKIVKGKWDDGKPRTFRDVCKGRLAKSYGWIPLYDLHKTFRTVSRPVWEAQQECLKPSTEGLVLERFDRDSHGIRFYVPLRDNGMIWQGVDFGGTNPHGVCWYQKLTKDVLVHGVHQARDEKPDKLLKKGTLVAFDEIYIAEIGNNALASMVVRKERVWARALKGEFRTRGRFADPAQKAARLDWAKNKPKLKSLWYCTRDQKEQIKTVVEMVDDDLVAVDIDRCPMWLEEAEAWHYPDPRKDFVDDPEIPVDDFNHQMSNFRYVAENIKVLERKGSGVKSRPKSNDRPHRSRVRASGDSYVSTRRMP